uniref:THAP domain-containing protein 11-like n=1 Tax=Diabrotica virgifera virgifera TaxID=50390 RepID=A0A6P7HAM3_DIAVI
MRCAVACCNSDNKDKTLRFHTFPKDSVARKLWIIACCRQDNFNCNTARICSKHFKTEDFQRNLQQELLNYESKKGPKLKPEAVPTLYLPKTKSATLSAIQKKRVQRAEHRESKNIVEQLLTTSESTTQLQVRVQEEQCSQADIKDVLSTSKSIG